MIHVGESGFYDRVYADALSHDVVLVEGLNSPITERITRSYRWMAGASRLQLIVQPQRDKLAHASKPVVLADLSHEEFVVHWRKVPLWIRVMIYFVAPLLGIKRRLMVSRAELAKGMSLDDLTSRNELLSWNAESGMVHHAILDSRDARLVEKLDTLLSDKSYRRIAVVYGARHMRAVLRHLVGKRQFQVRDMDWMTVFAL